MTTRLRFAPQGRGRNWRALDHYGLVAFIGAAMSVVATAQSVPAVLHGGLVDPDSFMRLVRIEQGLRIGHLVNMVQRDESGVPMVIEWSRLFDAIIVGLAAPLAPFLGWHRALLVGGVASGPLSVGGFCAAAAFAVAPLSDRRFLWMIPLIGPLVPGFRGFATFGVIHYHIAQIALVAATAGFALRAGRGRMGGFVASGIAGGFAIWMMPETMPFVLLSFVGLGYVWLFRPIGLGMRRLGVGFFVTLALALLLDPPHGGWRVAEIDRVSVVYLALGLAVALACGWLMVVDTFARPGLARSWAGVGGSFAAFGAWLAVFPGVALGPYGLIPARDMAVFFGNMTETQPVRSACEAALLLGPGLLALAYAMCRVWVARRDWLIGGLWVFVWIGGALGLALTARFVIFQQYPAGCAIALLPVVLSDVSARWTRYPARAAIARVGSIALLLIAPYAPSLANAAVTTKSPKKTADCRLRHIAPMMRLAAGAVVLTPAEDVPELLYRTRIIAVGSLYQHGINGYLRAWHAWRGPAAQSESGAFEASGAQFVLFCPGGPHEPLAGHAGVDALWSLLSRGITPPWLSLVAQYGANGFRLYRVQTRPGHG